MSKPPRPGNCNEPPHRENIHESVPDETHSINYVPNNHRTYTAQSSEPPTPTSDAIVPHVSKPDDSYIT